MVGKNLKLPKHIDSQILLYTSTDGETRIEVKLENDTVWLTQDQMAIMFTKGRSTITEHIQNIFREGELDKNLVCRDSRRTGSDDKEYIVKYYNLDVIISVGYRVKSLRGTQFRIWATNNRISNTDSTLRSLESSNRFHYFNKTIST